MACKNGTHRENPVGWAELWQDFGVQFMWFVKFCCFWFLQDFKFLELRKIRVSDSAEGVVSGIAVAESAQLLYVAAGQGKVFCLVMFMSGQI